MSEIEFDKSWTIRNVPLAISRAVAAAAPHGATGEWLGGTIDLWLAAGLEPKRPARAGGVDVKPWTIKRVPRHSRLALTRMAHDTRWEISDLLVAAIESRLGMRDVPSLDVRDRCQPAPDRLAVIVGLGDDVLKAVVTVRDLCRDELVLRRQAH
jgi:hypothetical protein